MAVEVGKGPAIKVPDAGMIADPRVKNWMAQRAEAAIDSVSLEVWLGTTDVQVVAAVRGRRAQRVVCLFPRLRAQPAEMVDLGDVEKAVRLLTKN